MSSQVSTFMSNTSDIENFEKRAKNPTLIQSIFNKGNVEQVAIDSNVATYRDAVRTACDAIEKKITDCKTLADFMKLFDVPMKDDMPTGNAPIYDFPDEI